MRIRWSVSKYRVELFADMANQWRFRIRHENDNVLASSEAYSSKNKAYDSAIALARDAGWPLAELPDRDLVRK